jgi:metal-responsive CopG/Arc/MetJ family transcriptional regulator
MSKHTKKIRINITVPPPLLKRIDKESGFYERSAWISDACEQKLEKKK